MDAKRRGVWLKVHVSGVIYALIVAAVLGMAWLRPVFPEGNSHDLTPTLPMGRR